jgi:DNA-damage-inducible protein J
VAQVNIRIDDDLKEQADSLFEELGMNMSTAVNVFIRQTLRQRKIPFAIAADSPPPGAAAEEEPEYGAEDPNDPFRGETNMRWIMESIRRAKKGKVMVNPLEELEAMADGRKIRDRAWHT